MTRFCFSAPFEPWVIEEWERSLDAGAREYAERVFETLRTDPLEVRRRAEESDRCDLY